jgi:ribosomal protein S18 acetylase RimI-like enzyme
MVTFHTDLDNVSAGDLEGFFEGWPNPPSPGTLLRLLRVTDSFVLARESHGRVVGFVTALTDGLLSTQITLLEVIPEYRDQGIGSELVRRIMEEVGDVYMVDAVCDPDVVAFYSQLGFTPSTAVSVRRYDKQAGLR